MHAENGLPYQVGFAGRSGVGKTTLIERLLPLLASAGIEVAVVKHTHHRDVRHAPGKDTWRFAHAGASVVLLVTPERVYVQGRESLEPVDDAASLVNGCKLVIHEGARGLAHPKVLVGESVEEAASLGTGGDVLALVGGEAQGLPVFDRDDLPALAAFIAGLVRANPAVRRPD